jgi:hypothetical protein
MNWAGRQIQLAKTWPTSSLQNLIQFQNTQVTSLAKDFGLQTLQLLSIPVFESLNNLEDVKHHALAF